MDQRKHTKILINFFFQESLVLISQDFYAECTFFPYHLPKFQNNYFFTFPCHGGFKSVFSPSSFFCQRKIALKCFNFWEKITLHWTKNRYLKVSFSTDSFHLTLLQKKCYSKIEIKSKLSHVIHAHVNSEKLNHEVTSSSTIQLNGD